VRCTTACSPIPARCRRQGLPGLLNPDSLKVVTYVEPSLKAAQADDKFQFERFGYFVADRKDHSAAHRCSTRSPA
jgi:hypothetical protein